MINCPENWEALDTQAKLRWLVLLQTKYIEFHNQEAQRFKDEGKPLEAFKLYQKEVLNPKLSIICSEIVGLTITLPTPKPTIEKPEPVKYDRGETKNSFSVKELSDFYIKTAFK